ncbi:unnamed protein product, partial [Rotaria magnacalcarata]
QTSTRILIVCYFRLLLDQQQFDHFFKHPFILHDLNNLQLLFDIINLVFFKFIINEFYQIFACVVEDTTPSNSQASKINFPPIPGSL